MQITSKDDDTCINNQEFEIIPNKEFTEHAMQIMSSSDDDSDDICIYNSQEFANSMNKVIHMLYNTI